MAGTRAALAALWRDGQMEVVTRAADGAMLLSTRISLGGDVITHVYPACRTATPPGIVERHGAALRAPLAGLRQLQGTLVWGARSLLGFGSLLAMLGSGWATADMGWVRPLAMLLALPLAFGLLRWCLRQVLRCCLRPVLRRLISVPG